MVTTTEEQQLKAIKKQEKKALKKLQKQQQQQQHLQNDDDIVVDPVLLQSGETETIEDGKKVKKNKKDKKRKREEQVEQADPEVDTVLDAAPPPSKKKSKTSQSNDQEASTVAASSAIPTETALSAKALEKQKKKEAKALAKGRIGGGEGSSAVMPVVVEDVEEEVRSEKKRKRKEEKKRKKGVEISEPPISSSTSIFRMPTSISPVLLPILSRSSAPDSDVDMADLNSATQGNGEASTSSSNDIAIKDHLGEKELRKTSRKEARKLQRLAMAAIQASSNLNGNGFEARANQSSEDEGVSNDEKSPPKKKSKTKSKPKGKSKEDPSSTKEKKKQRTSMPKKEDFGSMTPQDIISTKWLSPAQLKKLEQEYNFTLKSGKFSLAEDALLKEAITSYAETHELSPADINKLIFFPTKEPTSKSSSSPSLTSNSFWSFITRRLGNFRSLFSVFNRVRRIYNDESGTGTWTQEEIDLLRAAVMEYGTSSWSAVSKKVGRKPDLCRSRWLNAMVREEGGSRAGSVVGSGVAGVEEEKKVLSGKWTVEETDKLKKVVKDIGKNWTTVAKVMGGRSAKQCMDKWTDSVSVRDGLPSWEPIHRVILLHTIAKLDVSDVSEIKWKTIPEIEKRLAGFPASMLRKAWARLVLIAKKRGIDDFTDQVKYLVQLIPEDSTSIPKMKAPINDETKFELSKPKSTQSSSNEKASSSKKSIKAKGKEKATESTSNDILIDSVDPTLSSLPLNLAVPVSASPKGKGKEKEYKSTELVDSEDEDSSSDSSSDDDSDSESDDSD